MGSSTPSKLGWDEDAGQGHQAYPAESEGGITYSEDPRKTRLNCAGANHVGARASTSALSHMGAQAQQPCL